jgi:hypothetical protein
MSIFTRREINRTCRACGMYGRHVIEGKRQVCMTCLTQTRRYDKRRKAKRTGES